MTALSTELLLLKKKAATIAASSSSQRTAPNPSAPAGNRRLATSAAKSLLKTYVPTAPVAVVGSVASGLALDASDVDLVACLAGVRSAATFPCLLGDEPLGDPLLVLLLCGDHLPSVRVRKQSKKAKRTGRPRVRNKGDVDAALESTLEEHGFEAPRWARGSPLLRMVHRATGVAVDVWMDEAAADVAECEAKRRVDATRAAVLAPGGALLAGLHCLLRRAVGRELRELEGYAGGGGAGGGEGLGSYVTLLLVRRFLQRERVATVQPPPTQEALLVPLLTSLAATGGEDECTIEKLEDLLPGAPPLKVYPGKGTRMLRALCSTLLARLHAGASLEPLLHSHATEGWAVRAALVSDVLAAAQAGAQDKTAKPSKRART